MTLSKAGELRDCGFTLIELLVVCSILAALSLIAWGGYTGVQERAEDDIARAEMLRLADALKRFRADTGYYPGQGPFALAAPGTVETTSGDGYACDPVGGVRRSWAAPALDADKDAWFASPANLSLLFDAPALCANHPLAYLEHWQPDSGRGWHGPYLDRSARAWVDHGQDFNADRNGALSGAPYGDGNPVAGNKIVDIPAFGNGPRFSAAGPAWQPCAEQAHSTPSATCMLGWRTVPRQTTGYAAMHHELRTHARPFVVFGLADNDAPRLVYFGRDGRYGGRNAADPCLPNLPDPDGADDQVLCLNR